jgi:hypothetical protein
MIPQVFYLPIAIMKVEPGVPFLLIDCKQNQALVFDFLIDLRNPRSIPGRSEVTQRKPMDTYLSELGSHATFF